MKISNEEQTKNQAKESISELVVSDNQRSERLDSYLAHQLEKISRAQVQKLIKQ